MGQGSHLLRALTSTLFVPLQKVAELRVVLSFLLFDRHDVLERLLELQQVHVEVLLVVGKLCHFFGEDGHIPFLEVLHFP